MTLQDVYTPTFWAQQTLLQMYEMQTLIGLTFRDFQNQVAEQGDTVNTRLPNKFAVNSVDPADPHTTSQKATAENVQIKLTEWEEVTFELDDRVMSLSMKDLITEYVTPAAEALTNSVEKKIISLYKDVYQFIGSAGTTPSGVGPLGTDIKQKFDELLIPPLGRNVVLSPTAENEFHKLYWQAYVSGSTETQVTGRLMRKFGLDFYGSTQLGKHTKGTGWGTPLVSGAQTMVGVNGSVDSQGPVTVALKGLANNGTVNKGDIIQINGINYVLTANATANGAGAVNVSLSPRLGTNLADNDPVTVINTHAVNLGMHSQALALASRPLRIPGVPGANVKVVSYNGLGVRAARWYNPDKYREYVRLDLVYGVKTLDPRKIFRIMG